MIGIQFQIFNFNILKNLIYAPIVLDFFKVQIQLKIILIIQRKTDRHNKNEEQHERYLHFHIFKNIYMYSTYVKKKKK